MNCFLTATLLALSLPTASDDPSPTPGEPRRISLWKGRAPIGDGEFEKADAWITVHRPAKAGGAAIVICPGGGYGGLVREAEGHGIARWLNRHGITGVVLEYRLPGGRHDVPRLDAQRALRLVRANAKAWGVDSSRIGIMGFSAGGHLASTAGTRFDAGDPAATDPVERASCRPDFMILIYPVVTMGEGTHQGSKRNLLGPDPTPELAELFSGERQVTARTPPAFLAHARDDRVVPPEHSRALHRALEEHGVPSRYLELPSGGHGLNGYQGPMWDAWQKGSLEWLAGLKLSPPPAARPNVLFIISDDLGAQSLGCYGNTQCKTPNLDSLASRGVRFTRAYCQYPVCGPSRAALMSGMYAQAIGVTSNGAASRFTRNLGERPSMSQHFMSHGYHAARVSKIYHMRVPGDITAGVDGPDHAPSWTERFNCQGPEQWTTGEHEHLSRGALKPDPKREIHYGLGYGGAFYVVRASGDGAEQADHRAADRAVRILEQRAEDPRPFFLAVGLVRPHVPLVAPASFFAPYPAERMELPPLIDGDQDDIPRAALNGSSRSRGLDTRLEKQKVLEAYYACVSYMDAQVGRILGALDRLGLSEDTIVVFTADHGYHLGEHDLWQKMHLHDESTRIPLVVSVPGRKPGETDALCQQIDIYPTLAELCGLEVPPHVQGRSLVPALDDPGAVVHESVYCLRSRSDHLLRTDRWALIEYQDGRAGVELYDMRRDPRQYTNLATDAGHEEVLRDLRGKLDAKLASMGTPGSSGRSGGRRRDRSAAEPTARAGSPAVWQTGHAVVLQNDLTGVVFDLSDGRYSILDRRNDEVPVADAAFAIDGWSSVGDGLRRSWKQRPVTDELGRGVALDVEIAGPGRPTMLLSFVLHGDRGFLSVSAGIVNTTGTALRVKEIRALAGGQLYRGSDLTESFAMVDGFSGGEPLEYGRRLYSPLSRENALRSRNNVALTFGSGASRRTLVMGGLTYHDYEKFASIVQPRRVELERGRDGKSSLLCYLDLPDQTEDRAAGGEALDLLRGRQRRTWHYHEFRCLETATSAQGPEGVVIEARGLDPGRTYTLGFSWWRCFWHGNHGDHRQSVFLQSGTGDSAVRVTLLEGHLLPRFDSTTKEPVEQVEIPLPPRVYREGSFRLVFESANDPSSRASDAGNAYVSEVWLRDGASEGLLPARPTAITECPRPRRRYTGDLSARDPVGRRVDPGETYRCPDRFYIDATTADPFTALEQYGLRVRSAQRVRLSMYDFPTVCLWYAENSHYGGSEAENTTLGAVDEMRKIAGRGFLRYSRAAVRLVPDSYMPENQQGWWNDEHWQREVPPHNGSKNGRYVEPYETSEKWGRAVTRLGGIPLTYFQTGFRSEDYARAFPGHMLFNDAHAWKGAPVDPDDEMFEDWHKTWSRNGRLWGYDYTDPGFVRHLRAVYANLRAGGVQGLMFDYPASGWAHGGGLEDGRSTTAAAYRMIFRLAHEGLGPEPFVHERNMQRGTDVSIGWVASMRTENDTDRLDAATVARCGMRWYKNRVLYNQDTDSKNIVRLEGHRDRVRAVLTMAYVTTGRLLLANSFSQLSPETFHDLTRTFPYHTEPRSARPVDAFVSKNGVPTVYDFEVTPRWHQVTFFNPDFEGAGTVGIDLAGHPVDGALGLDPEKTYHVFDFWNDRYVGKTSGSARLEQALRPGEARMMSVRECQPRPQLLSTDRHVMQGYLDVVRTDWRPRRGVLEGRSRLVGGDPYVVTVASNGFRPLEARCASGDTKATLRSGESGLVELTLESGENRVVEWNVRWEVPGASSSRSEAR